MVDLESYAFVVPALVEVEADSEATVKVEVDNSDITAVTVPLY